MKKMKRIIGSIVISSMIFSTMSVAFAKSEKNVKVIGKDAKVIEKNVKQDITKIPGYYEGLSSYLGISIPDLKRLEAQYGELTSYLGLEIDVNRIGKSSAGEMKAFSSGGGSNSSSMSESDWKKFYDSATAGNIFITKDSWTAFVNHGHAAICETHNDPKDGKKYIVQAEAPGTKSVRREISVWRNVYTARVYYPTNVSVSDRIAAGEYAGKYLINLNYDPFADVNSSTSVNCATLVWKAYKAKGFELDTSIALKPIVIGTTTMFIPYYTCYPSDIVKDTDTTMKLSINWSGKDHSW